MSQLETNTPGAEREHKSQQFSAPPALHSHYSEPAAAQLPCSARPDGLARKAVSEFAPHPASHPAPVQRCGPLHPRTEPRNFPDIAAARGYGLPLQPVPPCAAHRPDRRGYAEIVPTTPSTDTVPCYRACRAYPPRVNLNHSESAGVEGNLCDFGLPSCFAGPANRKSAA